MVAIIYFGYIFISGEVKHIQGVNDFCKEECKYNSDNKNWNLNLKWFFDENGVNPRIEAEKSFSEKGFNECIDYCKDLEKEFKRLTSDPPDSHPY